MIIPDKKKAASQILCKMAAGGEVTSSVRDGTSEAPLNDGDLGKHAAAEDLMAALKSDSPHAVRTALSAFMDLHNPNMDTSY